MGRRSSRQDELPRSDERKSEGGGGWGAGGIDRDGRHLVDLYSIEPRRGARTSCCTARDRGLVLNCLLLETLHRRTAKNISRDGSIKTLDHCHLVPEAMSGLHVVQCLCHGEMFWGRVTQSTGTVALQVRSDRMPHSPPTHIPHTPSRYRRTTVGCTRSSFIFFQCIVVDAD